MSLNSDLMRLLMTVLIFFRHKRLPSSMSKRRTLCGKGFPDLLSLSNTEGSV